MEVATNHTIMVIELYAIISKNHPIAFGNLLSLEITDQVWLSEKKAYQCLLVYSKLSDDIFFIAFISKCAVKKSTNLRQTSIISQAIEK